jgi:hypothetical protein
MKNIFKKHKMAIALLVVVSLLVGLSHLPVKTQNVQAKAKVKLNKTKLTMTNNDYEVIKVKNPTKKVKWSISSKKYGFLGTGGKMDNTCFIYTDCEESGSFTVTAKVGTKKFKCKVTVRVKQKTTASPTAQRTPVPTAAPTAVPTVAPTAAPTTDENKKSIIKYIVQNGKLTQYGQHYYGPSSADSYHWGAYTNGIDSLKFYYEDHYFKIYVGSTKMDVGIGSLKDSTIYKNEIGFATATISDYSSVTGTMTDNSLYDWCDLTLKLPIANDNNKRAYTSAIANVLKEANDSVYFNTYGHTWRDSYSLKDLGFTSFAFD